MTIAHALATASKILTPTSDSPALDAEILLGLTLNQTKTDIFVNLKQVIPSKYLGTYLNLVQKRASGVPIAYLVGEKEFMGRSFFVSKTTLVPRPETENLVQAVLEEAKGLINPNILDIGTGSGCIVITLSLALRGNFYASDISGPALKTAQKNAAKFRTKVQFKRGSLLSPWSRQKIDVLVGNLPYGWADWQKNSNKNSLSLRFEPARALFAKEKGLSIIHQLLRQIAKRPQKPKLILLEFDPRQKTKLCQLAREILPEYKTQIVKDFAGRDRILKLKNRSG